jgi:pimeloyl-ACP methyl ester carboxylesterase
MKKFRFCLVFIAVLLAAVSLAQVSPGWHDPSTHRAQIVTVADGVHLEVLDWGGEGRAVVLLAGLGFTAHVFDDFAEKLAESCHVYGITRRGYGASSRPETGYSEERLTEDDLAVFTALNLPAPVVMGHSVAGNELSQLGIHHADRVSGLIYLDALNDGSDDWSELDTLAAKLPDAMKRRPPSSPSDLKSFRAFHDWRMKTDHIDVPEAELRLDFAENPDGSVGDETTPAFVPQAIMSGDHKHDYSQIRVPVVAFVGYPPIPQEQIRENHVSDPVVRETIAAVFGITVGMIRNRIRRIESAAGGARVVDLWGASHFVFLSNEQEVLQETREFLARLH